MLGSAARELRGGQGVHQSDVVRARAHSVAAPHVAVPDDDHITRPALRARHRVEDEHRPPAGQVGHEHEPERPAVEHLHARDGDGPQPPSRDHADAVVTQQLVADTQDQNGRHHAGAGCHHPGHSPGHSRSFGRNLDPEKIEEITPVPSTRSTSMAL